jgi:hypothetical protein
MVDKDIASAVNEYPRVGNVPDPNIDFRRVPNLYVFFERHAITLTSEVIPWDAENLKEWQPGDIVILGQRYDHIGIVSDKRFRNGIPKVLHHGSTHPTAKITPWYTGQGEFWPTSELIRISCLNLWKNRPFPIIQGLFIYIYYLSNITFQTPFSRDLGTRPLITLGPKAQPQSSQGRRAMPKTLRHPLW